MNRPSPPDENQPSRSPMKATLNGAIRHTRRVIVAVVGGTVLLLGVVMIVTPGPALVLIPLGLAILAAEFAWARYLLRRVREQFPNRRKKEPSKEEKDPEQ